MRESTPSLLEALVQQRPYLTRYAYAKLRHKGAAEDTVQETLMAAVEGAARFKGDSAPLTWLVGILKHKIVDWQRREARNPSRVTASFTREDDDHVETSDDLFDSDGRWVNPPSPWASPEQSLENRRFWEMLEGCLADLPVATARTFYLREIEGLQTPEICAELGITESNCWVMLHRARVSLREKIENRWFGKGDVRSVGERPARRSRAKEERRTPQLACRHPAHSTG